MMIRGQFLNVVLLRMADGQTSALTCVAHRVMQRCCIHPRIFAYEPGYGTNEKRKSNEIIWPEKKKQIKIVWKYSLIGGRILF
jgi:hypothetical protein